MSTKIYYAWRWNKSYDELILWLNDLTEDYIQDSINFISKNLDGITKENKYKKIHELLNLIQKSKISQNAGEPFDINLSCVVYQNQEDIVLHFFGLNEYKFPIIDKKLNTLQYFGYWNNADAEQGMSEEEWEYRNNWYEQLFDKFKSYIPSKCGLVYSFDNDFKVAEGAINKALNGNS